MIKKITAYSIFLFAAFLIFSHIAFAQDNPFSLKFPIPELGNCSSYDACKTYCDSAINTEACVAFGESHGLISRTEARQDKSFLQLLKSGDVPVAGCTDEETCGAKCSLPENQEACFKWAKAHGFIKSGEEFNNEKFNNKESHGFDKDKALKIIEQSGGPGGCKSEEECSNFCSQSANQQGCIKWAQDHGLMSAEDAQRAEKFANIIGPGGCRREECKTYCENPDHQAECFKFFKENGFISQEEADRIEKQSNLTKDLQTHNGPGGCQNADECRDYCSDPDHSQECINFAQKMGFFSKEEAEKHLREFQQQRQEFEKEFQEKSQESENKDNNFQKEFKENNEEFNNEEFQNNEEGSQNSPEEFNQPGVQQQLQQQIQQLQQQLQNLQQQHQEFNQPRIQQLQQQIQQLQQQLQKESNQQEGFSVPIEPQGFQPSIVSQIPSSTLPQSVGQTLPSSTTITVPPPIPAPSQLLPIPTLLTPTPSTSAPHTLLQYSPFGAILDFFLGR